MLSEKEMIDFSDIFDITLFVHFEFNCFLGLLLKEYAMN
jgi:hypothetical protein